MQTFSKCKRHIQLPKPKLYPGYETVWKRAHWIPYPLQFPQTCTPLLTYFDRKLRRMLSTGQISEDFPLPSGKERCSSSFYCRCTKPYVITTAAMKLGLGRDKKGQSYFQMAYYSTEKVQVLKKNWPNVMTLETGNLGKSRNLQCFQTVLPSLLRWELWHPLSRSVACCYGIENRFKICA